MPRTASTKNKPATATLVRTIFETLRDEIASGTLPPGHPLSRRVLAKRFGCSYATIVEVMVRLEHTELIEAETSQMARVVRPTLDRLREAHVLIEAYETEAIRLACESATAGEIDDLYTQAAALDERIAACDPNDHLAPLMHVQFHQRIAWLGRAPSLVRAMERSQLLVRCQKHWVLTAKEMPDPPRWHSVLVDAIKNRDPLAADAAMRIHFKRGLEKDLLAYHMSLGQ